MDLSEIQEKIKTFLVEEFEVEENKVKPAADLKKDLGIDSLEVVDVVVEVDRVFGVKLKSEDFKVVRTFGDLCEFIERNIND
ncbi:MAG: acyl carrier protein [Bacteroidales bacterium]|nr:acyl carrier protein [Bacteroidales bacterium]